MAIGDKVRKAMEEKAARELADQETAETPAPVIPQGFDMAQFASMLGLAIKEGTAGAIEQTKPRVMSREDWEFENKSAYNPMGELARPRPGLSVPTYYGVLADKDSDPPIQLYEIESAQTTYDEQILLNQLAPSKGQIEMNDGTPVPYEVYVQTDRVTGQPSKRIIGLPKDRYEKQLRGTLPALKRLVAELLSRQAQAA